MKKKRVGNSSSKYDLNPEQFEKDVMNKLEVAKQFEEDLEKAIYREYRYKDNSRMSNRAKREILIKVHKRFLNK